MRLSVTTVRQANRLLLKMAGGRDNILFYRFLQVVVVCIPVVAIVIAMAISRSVRQVELARIEVANQAVRQAVEKADKWIQDGSLTDADQIEAGLNTAEANAVATQKALVGPTLMAFRNTKSDRQAASLLDSALTAIAQKQFDKAHAFLRQYLQHPSATKRQKALALLSEIALATSDEDALRTLLAMNDKSFASFSKGDVSSVVLSQPALVDTRVALLKKNLAEASRQREEKRKQAEAERLAEQKRIAAETEAAQRRAADERRTEQAKQEAARPKVYGECRPVFVGYNVYNVLCSWWSDKLTGNEFLDHPPDAKYLFVLLMVTNISKESRIVPPFKLVDDDGAVYDASGRGWMLPGSIGVLESLNPGVRKSGFVVFDVPENRNYRLKASGGFWSLKDAFIRLSPKASALEAAKTAIESAKKFDAFVKSLGDLKIPENATAEEVTEIFNQRIDELEKAATNRGTYDYPRPPNDR